MLLSASNSYTGATNVNAGSLQANGSIASSSGVAVASSASFIAGATQTLTSLTINSAGLATIDPGGGKLLTTANLSILGTGKLDVNDNGVAVEYTTSDPLSTIMGQIITGFSGGAWNGSGITSSVAAVDHRTALGYAEASSVLSGNTFMGQTITLPAVLVRFVLQGDANLDGVINSIDFNALAAHFNSGGLLWSQGDFNYNGNANASDFDALASDYGQSVPAAPLESPPLGASIASAPGASPNLFSDTSISDPLDRTSLFD